MEIRRNLLECIDQPIQEQYTFQLTPEKLNEVEEYYLSRIRNRILLCFLLLVPVILVGLWTSEGLVAFTCAVLMIGVIRFATIIHTTKQNAKSARKRYLKTWFTYTLYGECLAVQISSESEYKEMIVELDDIKKIREFDAVIALEINQILYIIDKQILPEESYFLRRSVRE